MTRWLLQSGLYHEYVVVFANTGEENEQTLEFVDRCDKTFSFNTVWIEAVQKHGERKSPSFKIVDFHSASRSGEPFEDMIHKHGIPNTKFKHCTRELKRKPIEAYAKSLGWDKDSYDTAIGIRIDEIDRMSSDNSLRLFYPLATVHPVTKVQINTWWAQQPFRLELKGYQGNCKWCWKKSFRKHFTIIRENPMAYRFPYRMEKQYAGIGPEFVRHADDLPAGYKRTFFRGNKSVVDLFTEFEGLKDTFVPAADDAQVFTPELDVGSGCEESCEVYAEEDER